ncbi:MAG: acyloxyacyl hydrolase [Gammaproteobacteria bacterium]|nr:acyloxyacyl hydrolase [Gammaproteobacteria bacterium]
MRTGTTKSRLRETLCATALLFVSMSLQAIELDGMTFGAGPANEDIVAYRFSLRDEFKRTWFESKVGRLTGNWDFSVGVWDGNDNEIVLLAASPVWVYEFSARPLGLFPYIDIAVGVSLLSDHEIDGRELSTHFQFEDRIGLGLRFGDKHQHALVFNYFHYSNANFEKPNDGIDIFMTSFVYRFGVASESGYRTADARR